MPLPQYLLKSAEHMKQIRHAFISHLPMLILDKQGVIIYANDRFTELSGYSKDELINQHPPHTGGSTPYALVTHILGACEWWVGHMVAGDESHRVRGDEFTASGSVAELHAAVTDWLELLTVRRPALAAATELTEIPKTQTPLAGEWTVGAALIHGYEELAQHLGHLEVTADLLLAHRSA